ncbi:hypothetical protein UYO_2765 [Lachnospiraceae bacterium JC7]|nr:hypothetical protein UYO_2765 [Lachnospiraceae bacterium JC7]
MSLSERVKSTYIKILEEELIPAMGCTEPIAIAYCSSRARDLLGKMPDCMDIFVSNNIIKNVKSVVVPNTNGLKGIEAAAAAGLIAGNTEMKLEVISKVSDEQKSQICSMLNELPIRVIPMEQGMVFDIEIILKNGNDSSKVRISQYHTNIIYEERNGEILLETELYRKLNKGELQDKEDGLADHSLLNISDIIEFADTVDLEEVREILDRQIEYNSAIADEGINGNYGANIGKTLILTYGEDVRNRAMAKAAAGSDARMSGCEMPVVINSGSGNQGITVSVPVIEYAGHLGVSREVLYRALIVSNLIAIHEKTGIGRLSAYCGAVSAGCAAGCGIAYLYGGGFEEISHTLVNSLAIVSGIICDGAKASCAGKIAASVEAGILGYHMYKNGQEFKKGEGIVNKDAESTIDNVSRLGKEGMRETDKEIVKIMLAVG